jgi:glycosyltransferase involved in cell wall biosynthesis
VPVAYPVGVVPELIQDGVNGFIVATQEEAYARTRELLADDTMRLAMAKAAKESIEPLHSDRIAGELMGLYQNLRRDRKASAGAGPAA